MVELAPLGRLSPAHGQVQSGEQRVLDQDARAGQPVEQRRFARVGVSRNRDRVAHSFRALSRLVSRAVFMDVIAA